MTMTCDEREFREAVVALFNAAQKCRDASGLLIQPPTFEVARYRALVRGALTALYDVPVSVSDEKQLPSLFQVGGVLG